MILYIDLIIILNVFVNYIFIKSIKIIHKEKFTIMQLILSTIVSILSFSLFFVPVKYIYNLRYYTGILIGIMAFNKKDIKTLFIQIIIFYLFNLSFIGCLIIFRIDNIILLLLCVIFITTLWFIESFKKDIILTTVNERKLKIGNKAYTGYYDSGNCSYCDNIPVVYLDKENFSNDYKYLKNISVFTISGKSDIKVYTGPLLHMKNKDFVVYYAFIESLGKKVILNKELGE